MATMEELIFDEQIYDTIRRNIKKYRKERGITSAQLAEMVVLSHDFIRQIESEKTRYNFSLETFYKISVALGVGMDKLAEAESIGWYHNIKTGAVANATAPVTFVCPAGARTKASYLDCVRW